MAQARRRVLSLAVYACCHEAGFTSAEESVIEILTVMLQTLITEAGREAQLLAEHNGRCETTPGDVLLALIDLGINLDSLVDYGKRRNPIRIPTPGREQPSRQPTILQAGRSRPLHPYIPDHFPPFPDSHAFVRTPTHRQPISDYEAIRDKAACQKRDLERALTRFMAKTFQPSPLPFMDALKPKDQIFDDDSND